MAVYKFLVIQTQARDSLKHFQTDEHKSSRKSSMPLQARVAEKAI